MSIILSPYPKLQFIDNNGNPMANCLLYTYIAGTNIPIATYSDSTGLIANSTPIVLDAGGRASVWLDSTKSYKYIVKNSDSTTLFTVDNINSSTGQPNVTVNTISALRAINTNSTNITVLNCLGYYTAGDGGGGTFNYYPASTKSDDSGMIIAPTVGSGRWIRPYSSEINVLWYGAIGDSTTNNTQFFQLANTYSSANNLNIIIPNGTFYLASDPGLTVPVKFSALSILKFSGFSPSINAVISDINNQHFNMQVGNTVNFGSSITKIYPEWFGAKGDGSFLNNTITTDDTYPIQIAIFSCVKGSSVIFNSNKKYWCNTISLVPSISIVGSNSYENDTGTTSATEYSANLQYIGTGGTFITLSNSGFGGLAGPIIRGLIIDGNLQAGTLIGFDTTGSLIENCTLRNASFAISFNGVSNSTNNRVNNCNIRNINIIGIINVGSGCTNGYLTNLSFINCIKDIQLNTQSGWIVNNIQTSFGINDSYYYGESTNYNYNTLDSNTASYELIKSDGGNANSTVSDGGADQNLWDRKYLIRNSNGSTLSSAGIHSGLTENSSNNVPMTSTRSWNQKNFNGIQQWGDQAAQYMALNSIPVASQTGILSLGGLSFDGTTVSNFTGTSTIPINGGSNYAVWSVSNKTVTWYLSSYPDATYGYWPSYNAVTPTPRTQTVILLSLPTANVQYTMQCSVSSTWIPNQYIYVSNKQYGDTSSATAFYGKVISYNSSTGTMVLFPIYCGSALAAGTYYAQSAWPWAFASAFINPSFTTVSYVITIDTNGTNPASYITCSCSGLTEGGPGSSQLKPFVNYSSVVM